MGLPDYTNDEFKDFMKRLSKANSGEAISVNFTQLRMYLKLPEIERQQYIDSLVKWNKTVSDGSTASYYVLPKDSSELQDLISAKNMNAQVGEIFRECYRYGQASHSDEIRGIKKILFYANAELKRLQNADTE
jgi:primase-polymerase (primpol)-like protein